MIDRTIKTKEAVLKYLKNEDDREKAEFFFSFAENEDLDEKFRVTAKYYSYSFFPKGSPRALFKMDLNDITVRIKAQLFFIGEHNGDLQFLPESLKNMIKATPPCTRCSMQCKQGIEFELDGESFFTCINEGHYFKGMTLEECHKLIELLKTENDFIRQMKEKQ